MLVGLVGLALLAPPGATAAVVGRGSAFHLAPGMHASALTLGPDGNMWFGGSRYGNGGAVDVVGRVTPGGDVVEFTLPPGNESELGISSIVAGSDGNLYFTEPNANAIGRASTGGKIESFPLPNAGSMPRAIAVAPDGTLWITEEGTDRVGRIDFAASELEETQLSPGARPTGIAARADGTIWVAEPGLGRIGRRTPEGSFGSLKVAFPGSLPNAVVPGPEGNVWFTDEGGPWLNRVTSSSLTRAEYDHLTLPFGRRTRWLAFGPHGDFWFTSGNRIGSIASSEFLGDPACLPGGCDLPVEAIAAGPEGKLWYASGPSRLESAGAGSAAGTIGTFEPPRISATISRHASRLAGRYVKVGISCRGGAGGQFCRGRVRILGIGDMPAMLGSRGLDFHVRASRRIRVRLSKVAATLLARKGRLPARVVVTLAGGSHAERRVVLHAGGKAHGPARG